MTPKAWRNSRAPLMGQRRSNIWATTIFVTNKELVEEGRRPPVPAMPVLIQSWNRLGQYQNLSKRFLPGGKKTGFRSVVSARSGETEDVTIVIWRRGLVVGRLKVGYSHASERMAKWNECLRIQDIHWQCLLSRARDGYARLRAGTAGTWWAAKADGDHVMVP